MYTNTQPLHPDLVNALQKHALATAEYSQRSLTASIAARMQELLKTVADVQQALEESRIAELHSRLGRCARELQGLGMEADFRRGHFRWLGMDQHSGESDSHSAVHAFVLAACEHAGEQFLTRLEDAWKLLLRTTTRDNAITVEVAPEAAAFLWHDAEAYGTSSARSKALGASISETVVKPLFAADNAWDAERHGRALTLHRKDEHGSPFDALEAVLANLRAELFDASVATPGEAALAPRMQVAIARHLVPELVTQAKAWIKQHLAPEEPTVGAANRALSTSKTMANTLQEHLSHAGYVGSAPRRHAHVLQYPGWAQPEPLSDLDEWAEHLGSALARGITGDALSHVRQLIMRTDDANWQSVKVERRVELPKAPGAPQLPNEPAPAEHASQRTTLATIDVKPHSGSSRASAAPAHAERADASTPTPAAKQTDADRQMSTPEPVRKNKKPTLGGVKKINAMPPVKSPAPVASVDASSRSAERVSAPAAASDTDDADWGWGDDDELASNDAAGGLGDSAATAPSEATKPETDAGTGNSDDWGWDDNASGNDSAWSWGEANDEKQVDAELGGDSSAHSAGTGAAQIIQANSASTPQKDATLAAQDASGIDETDDAWGWDDEQADDMPEKPSAERNLPHAKIAKRTQTAPTESTTADVDAPHYKIVLVSVSQRSAQVAKRLRSEWDALHVALDGQASQTLSVPALPPALAQSIVDCARLYRMLMPVIHGKALESVPSLCMLFANDCRYLAETLQDTASRAKSMPQAHITRAYERMAAEAVQLTSVGGEWFDAQLLLQTRALQECVDGADGFARTDDDARYAMCERAVGQVGHILKHLVTVWRDVLQPDELATSLGSLVNVVFNTVLQKIEDLQDISEPESVRLAALCRMLLEQVQAAFALIAGAGDDAAMQLAATAVRCWFKFSYLPEILMGSLADIDFLLFDPEGGGALTDYTKHEISAFVRALFADSPNRRRLLERVQRCALAS